MTIWAIADLHLSFATPDKRMDRFGSHWVNHESKIEIAWRRQVDVADLVLLAGDISWATKSWQVIPDLEWLEALPGDKLLVRGNHDYWWPRTRGKLDRLLPPSVHALHNDAYRWHDVAIAGCRLWDIPGLHFDHLIEYPEAVEPVEAPMTSPPETAGRIFRRELHRLARSLEQLGDASERLCVTHFPPTSEDLKDTDAVELIERYGVTHTVFGHLHNINKRIPIFGVRNNTRYSLVAGDYLDFQLARVL